jgi:NAD-dependent SIR2 family protein deacetylase
MQLPERFHDLIKGDADKADLVLILGTSLKVHVLQSEQPPLPPLTEKKRNLHGETYHDNRPAL